MLNFTAGAANILSACTAAQVRHVLTSRAFVAQAKLAPVIEEMEKQVEIVWLDLASLLKAGNSPFGQNNRHCDLQRRLCRGLFSP